MDITAEVPQNITTTDVWNSSPATGNLPHWNDASLLEEAKHFHVYCSTVQHNCKIETNQESIYWRMDKENTVPTHSEILFCRNMYKILSFVTTQIELEVTVISEISKTQKDR